MLIFTRKIEKEKSVDFTIHNQLSYTFEDFKDHIFYRFIVITNNSPISLF